MLLGRRLTRQVFLAPTIRRSVFADRPNRQGSIKRQYNFGWATGVTKLDFQRFISMNKETVPAYLWSLSPA